MYVQDDQTKLGPPTSIVLPLKTIAQHPQTHVTKLCTLYGNAEWLRKVLQGCNGYGKNERVANFQHRYQKQKEEGKEEGKRNKEQCGGMDIQRNE